MTTLEVINPCGPVGSSTNFAPRLSDLNGKTIGMLSNMLGEADRTFARIRELLEKRFPDATVLGPREFPEGGDHIDAEGIVDIVRGRGCDAVITGNAQ